MYSSWTFPSTFQNERTNVARRIYISVWSTRFRKVFSLCRFRINKYTFMRHVHEYSSVSNWGNKWIIFWIQEFNTKASRWIEYFFIELTYTLILTINIRWYAILYQHRSYLCLCGTIELYYWRRKDFFQCY